MINSRQDITEVIILCGGKGERLRKVVSQDPKPLAPLGGGVFLDLLVHSLIKQKIKKIIFSVGYLKEKIIERYCRLKDVEVYFSEEDEPLGTGGAIKRAINYVNQKYFIVINGDSFIDVSYGELIKKFLNEKGGSLIVLNRYIGQRGDVNHVIVKNDQVVRVESYGEKNNSEDDCYVNCGIYLFDKNYFENEKKIIFSLEEYLIPKIINEDSMIPFITNSSLYDIGTPERYFNFLKSFN